MSNRGYLPANERQFSNLLTNFANSIGTHAAALGITDSELAALRADAGYYDYVLTCQEIAQGNAGQWISWRKLVRNGGAASQEAAGAGAPVFPAAVPAVEPGIEGRFRKLVQSIKAHVNYNEAIGRGLGIEAAETAGPDLATIQPDIDVRLAGNKVEVDWGWGGHTKALDMCEIQVDRGAGFQLLTFDTTPGYVDSHPLPSAPAKWTYRAIYRVDDDQVGQWSKPVSVMVAA